MLAAARARTASARETRLDAELRGWLAFGDEKLDELRAARGARSTPTRASRDELLAGRAARASRRAARVARDQRRRACAAAVAALRPERLRARRAAAPSARRSSASGSGCRRCRPRRSARSRRPPRSATRAARHRAGELDDAAYDALPRAAQIEAVIREQEALGLDVLVHGEPERNDMVEYFGERLDGFAFTRARLGAVLRHAAASSRRSSSATSSRPAPMTVRWWQHAQALTDRPMKGMLTGPVTILQWSFVRDDQPRARDLRADRARDRATRSPTSRRAGAAIDPGRRAGAARGPAAAPRGPGRLPALGGRLLPARRPRGARPETQIHTHMCYSEFGDIIEHIARLDADVISIEASRSGMELLDGLRATSTTPARSAPASTTSTRRACRRARSSSGCSARRGSASAASGCG